MTPLLDLAGLTVSFTVPGGTLTAVERVSFAVPRGQTVAIVGESGSGKTAIAQALMGILPPNGRIAAGRATFERRDGRAIDLAAPEAACARGLKGGEIAMIFQEPMAALSPLHTIGDQIGEVWRVHRGAGRGEARARAIAMLGRVGVPDPARRFAAYPFELSGGLRQRAMIAMALMNDPLLLIADEPTTALDVTTQAQVLKLLSDLREEFALSLLLITHDLGVVANLADLIVVMYRGRVMEMGSRYDVLLAPRHPYTKALLAAVPVIGKTRFVRLQPLREPPHAAAARTRPPDPGQPPRGAPILSLERVSKQFAPRPGVFAAAAGEALVAVNGVSLTLLRGECLGIVGESGSGKSTLGRLMLGALEPEMGRVYDCRRRGRLSLAAMTPAERRDFRRRVQLVFQDPFASLNPRRSVGAALAEPMEIAGEGPATANRARAAALLARVGLDAACLARFPHAFSGGQRQRIVIARALAPEPEVLVLDEPVSALDVSVQAQVLNLLRDLRTELDLSYVFISHNLAVVDYMADRIAVMCRGRIVELAPTAALFADPRHPYTRALLAAVPDVDPDARLDLTALMEGRASDPGAWPVPFTLADGEAGTLTEIAPGHFVALGLTADGRPVLA